MKDITDYNCEKYCKYFKITTDEVDIETGRV
jgi:hypothetical protein